MVYEKICKELPLSYVSQNDPQEAHSYRRDSARLRSVRPSRSFKVTDFGTKRKHVYHFLLVN